jgi:hypothetical protein
MEIAEVQSRVEEFLTGQMLAVLRTVEVALPPFSEAPRARQESEAAKAHVEVRHLGGSSDAHYLVKAFGDELFMQLQLNVCRFVIVYKVPAVDALDAAGLAPRLERWRIGAEHAGWKMGFRDSADPPRRWVDTYAYAHAPEDLLANPPQQLFWRTDIMQMTRWFMLETRRCGIRLSPNDAGYDI